MRIAIIGGTEFIGRRTVEMLIARGDEVMVVHRGSTEPVDLPPCEHVHAERAAFASVAARVTAFRPDAMVDTIASSAADRDAVLPHLPDVPVVVLSSMDVYRFFELLHADDDTPVLLPFDESGELRHGRYPYAGRGIGEDEYEKLDVEPAYLERGSYSMRGWMRLILAAAGHDAELVRVAEGALPPDLRLTRAMLQHFVASSAKAMSRLDWTPTPTAAAVASSVRWHLENPPAEGDAPDFAADDAVLASVG